MRIDSVYLSEEDALKIGLSGLDVSDEDSKLLESVGGIISQFSHLFLSNHLDEHPTPSEERDKSLVYEKIGYGEGEELVAMESFEEGEKVFTRFVRNVVEKLLEQYHSDE